MDPRPLALSTGTKTAVSTSSSEREILSRGTTSKRLPWLDGRVTPANSPLSPGHRPLATPQEDNLSPTARLNRPTASKRSPASPPTLRADKFSPSRIPHIDDTSKIARSAHVSDEPEELFSDARSPEGNLAPVPAHLEQPVPHDSVDVLVPVTAQTVSPPRIITTVKASPSQPTPERNQLHSRSGRRLSNAIEGLEDMMQEAVVLAEDERERRQVEEIYEIIEDARNAIHEAKGDPARQLMETRSPLRVSGSSVGDSMLTSPWSYSESPNGEIRPMPEKVPISLLQKNVLEQPIPTDPNRPHADEAGCVEGIDWARQSGRNRSTSLSSSSNSSIMSSWTSESSERGRSRSGTGSDLLLQPEPTQTAERDFVLRPLAREHSRGRSSYRNYSGETGARKRLRHRGFHSHDRSRPRYRHHRISDYNHLSDASHDEEKGYESQKRPRKRRRHRDELRARDQVHHHTFGLNRGHRRQPIARNWSTGKKRLTATIACINTALLGIIVGIYASNPNVEYMLADERHHAIVGNVVLYFGLAISTFIAWPLPLLHGRKPYILAALAMALPLQFPQAIVVGTHRSPDKSRFRVGLLVARAASGLVLGFANVNYITVLLDLFGASLQSKTPHQEFVVPSDVRRHGGGMGMWLGIWSWCSIGSLAAGFQIGAGIIGDLTPDWGFYVVIIILASALVLNVVTPETRRAMYRKSVTEVYDRDQNFITRRVSRGEVKLHISTEGPKYWFEEVYAGIKLTVMMLCQPGFFVLSFYLGWIYAQIVLVIVLLGSLLSRDYKWYPRFVGLGVMSIAIGALLAVPLTKAGIFSRDRKRPFRTDSMTFEKQVTWTSHLVRRILFTITLPLMGLAYTVSSAGRPKPYMVPIIFAGAVGFFSILAITECHGLIMETFDTCDLQPGVNTRHRLQSMAVQDRRRRTNYSSFPRVTAGIFASQTFSFMGAAVATEVGGIMTRRIGAQASTGVTAGILLFLTILLTLVLWRFRNVQVIPNHTFGMRRDTQAWEEFGKLDDEGQRRNSWRAVVIGNPSGKMRRMSVLEMGALSRWTEIRKLNFLVKEDGGRIKV